MKYQAPTQNGGPGGEYITGNPATGTKGSIPPGPAIEHPMREIIAVIVAGGLTPDENVLNQMLLAINQIIANAVSAGLFKNVNETLEAGFLITPLALDGSSGTITPNYSLRNQFKVAVDKNMVLANPAAMPPGGMAIIEATVDAGGSYSLDFGSSYKISHGKFNTTAGAINKLYLLFRSDGKIDVHITQGVA